MKTLVLLLVLAISARAQDALTGSGNFLGARHGSGRAPTQQEIEAANQVQINNKYRLLGGHIFRRINGQIVNMLEKGEIISGKVNSVEDDGIVIIWTNPSTSDEAAIKNFPKVATDGLRVECVACPAPVYRSGTLQLVQWDCGQIVSQEEENQQVGGILKAREEARKVVRNANAIHDYMAQSNAIVWLTRQATNGDVSAQYSLANHYLNGQGCPTNLETAVLWLKKAASAGSIEASNKLVTIGKQLP